MGREIIIKDGKNFVSHNLVGKATFNSRFSKVTRVSVRSKSSGKAPIGVWSLSATNVKKYSMLDAAFIKHDKEYVHGFSSSWEKLGNPVQDCVGWTFVKETEHEVIEEIEHEVIEKTEHEVTREYISERIDKLASELVKKEDLIKVKDEIINSVKAEAIQTQKLLKDDIFELKESLLRYLPHKTTFRISTYFLTLFLFVFFADMLGVQIIKPFWNMLGMSVSGGFLIMAYFLFLDWQKCNVNGIDS